MSYLLMVFFIRKGNMKEIYSNENKKVLVITIEKILNLFKLSIRFEIQIFKIKK